MLCVSVLGCDFLTAVPSEDAPSEVDLLKAPSISSSLRSKACEKVTEVRKGVISHSDFSEWIYGQPDFQEYAIFPDYFQNALLVYAGFHLSSLTYDIPFDTWRLQRIRDRMLRVLSVRCGIEDEIGVEDGPPPACDLWQQHRKGAISPYKFVEEFLSTIGTPTRWQEYSGELSNLYFALYSAFEGTHQTRDFVEGSPYKWRLEWELGAIGKMIDELCLPQTVR